MPYAQNPAEIDQLVALFNAGHFVELESLSRRIIEQCSDSGFAWKILGTCLEVQSKDGLPALQRAAELLPEDADVHSNLGLALKNRGRLDEGVVSYHRALEINPDFAEAHSNLGAAQMDLGRLKDAVMSLSRALEIRPSYAKVHNNLGGALKDLGRRDEAVTSFRRAHVIQPDYAKAHSNLGAALKDLERLDDAVESYRRALNIESDSAKVHSNLGVTLKDLGSLDDAIVSFRRAQVVQPDYAIAHSNLGLLLKDLGKLDEAVTSFRRALNIESDYAEAHNNLGVALNDLGRLEDAVLSYRRAQVIQPDYAIVHSNLGVALYDLAVLNDAVMNYRRALVIQSDCAEAQSNLLFSQNYLSDQPAEVLLSEARWFGKMVAQKARPYSEWHNIPDPGRSLRVGWVSGDFRNHPVGYFVEGVLAALVGDGSIHFHHFAYHNHSQTDALTERIRTCFQEWHPVMGLSDQRLAERIHNDGIDILLDLSGHTAHNRLPVFAWKPAPVQASWLGYFATTGVAEIDYLIADPWTLPTAEEAHFSEKIWRLPESRLCFSPPDLDVAVSPLPAMTNGYITFGCLSKLSKINDAVVDLWARVLAAVPNSCLLLKSPLLNEPPVRQGILRRFSAKGISTDRLILEGSSARREYLATYGRLDIVLDTFPFPGGTTSVESLWMGVPVLTLMGERFLSRQGVGLLMNAGLSDWIAADPNDYISLAVSHAGNLLKLASLRQCLRQRILMSPVFDAKRFARNFEVALRGMWTQWCDEHQSISS